MGRSTASSRWRVPAFAAVLLAAALSLAACGDSSGAPGAGDVAADVLDDAAPADVRPDVPPDVAPDVAPDVPLDVPPDVPADVPPPCPNDCCGDADCADDDPCTVDICTAAGTCAWDRYDCDDGEACTADVCVGDGTCAHGPIEGCCALAPLFGAAFEDGTLGGLTVTDRAQNTRPAEEAWDQPIVWRGDDERTHGGRGALYAGSRSTRLYDNGRQVATSAETPTVALPAGLTAELRFWTWMDVEETVGYDALNVQVLVMDAAAEEGAEETERARVALWSKPAGFPLREWRPVSLDLSAFAGERVRVAFLFDTIDGSVNGFEGVYLDDVALGTRCERPACAADADCDDGLACTADSCDAATGACAHAWSDGCCLNAIDCNDALGCTTDACTPSGGAAGRGTGSCVNVPLPLEGCCEADADCDDGDPCTTARCLDHVCAVVPSGAPGCCAEDADCADEDPCTEATCTKADGTCAVTDRCECRYDIQCADADPTCTREACTDGLCTLEPTLRTGCCAPEVFLDRFESVANTGRAWTFQNGGGSVGWTVRSGGGSATSGALYYGNPATGSYGTGATRNSGTATSRELDLPAAVDVTLEFDLFLGVESGPDHDTFRFTLLVDGSELTLFEKDFQTATYSWQHLRYDLSGFAGRTVRFRAAFDTMDGEGNDGEGVYLDDFEVVSLCRARECASAANCGDGFGATTETCVAGLCRYRVADQLCDTDEQCEDGDICTRDVCELGGCTFPVISGCCGGDAECDDDDVCTRDACVGTNPPLCQYDRVPGCCQEDADCGDGNDCTDDACPGLGEQCVNVWREGCCLLSAQCADDDPCTADRCVDNECAHVWSCCETDAECDDGDDVCTTDTCVDQYCRFTLDPTNPACCEPEPIRVDFEDGTLMGFTSTGGAGGDAWQVVSGGAHTGSYAMAFTGPGGTYHSSTAGVADGPPFELPEGQRLTFSFWLELDTEEGYDGVSAALVGDGVGLELGYWEGTRSWFQVSEDVTFLGGRTVRLRLEFTSDGSIEEYGVKIDDIVVTSACAPPTCTSDRDCATPTGCVVGTCAGGACVFEPQPDCCQSNAECDDGDSCTVDRCVANSCEFGPDPANPGCCHTDADCDDGAACTTDRCVAGRCTRQCPAGCAYQFPYTETFDSASSIPTACWSTQNVSGGGTSGWTFAADGYEVAGPHLYFDAMEATATGAYLQCVRSPTIDASLAISARLRFDHYGYTWDSGFTVKARVSADNGATWTDVFSRGVSDEISGPTTVDVFGRIGGSPTVRVAMCVQSTGSSYFPWMTWEVDNVRLEGDVYQGGPPTWDTQPGEWVAPVGAETRFPLAGSDPDGDRVTFRLGAGAPPFVAVEDAGDGTATLVVTPLIGDEGPYEVEVVLSDPWLGTPQVFPLTVSIPGGPPEVADPGPQTVVVNTVLRVALVATDPDGDPITFAPGAEFPAFAALRDGGAGTAWLTLSPRIADLGAHEVALVLSDGTQNVPFVLPVAVVPPGERAPLVEDFEAAPALDLLGWTADSDPDSAVNDWLLLPDPTGADGQAATYLDVPVVDGFTDALVSPAFETLGLGDPRVRWTTAFRDYGPLTGEPPVALELLVSPDDGATWLPVWTHAETDGDLPRSTLDVAAPDLVDAAAARVAFRVSGGTSGALLWWSVDDVIVYGTATPPPEEP